MIIEQNVNQKIVATALRYLNQIEKKNNSGFIDQDFESKMKAVGWMPGESWCVYLAELIWEEAYKDQPDIILQLVKLFSGSATKTYKNFVASKKFVVSKDPVPGALIIFQYGSGWQGHAGVVVDKAEKFVITVEGNTNDDGSREGVKACQKTRKLNQPKGQGLNILGFVHPIDPLTYHP